ACWWRYDPGSFPFFWRSLLDLLLREAALRALAARVDAGEAPGGKIGQSHRLQEAGDVTAERRPKIVAETALRRPRARRRVVTAAGGRHLLVHRVQDRGDG